MKFELNINDTYKNFNNIDEWGCAFLFDNDSNCGVEYNFCIDNNENCCAIYYFEDTYMNYDKYIHYEIDFSSITWEIDLKEAMGNALKFFKKCLTNNLRCDSI